MNLLYRALLPLFLFFLIISCSNKKYESFQESSYKDKGLTLKKNREFILNSSSVTQNNIGKLRFYFVSNQNNSLFAFYDEIKKQFIITDNKGRIQSIISRKGKGPGEIVKIGGYNFDEQNQLVTFDEGQMKIDVFDINGEIVRDAKINNDDFFIGGRELFTFKGKIYTDIIDKNFLGKLREDGDLRRAGKSRLAGIYNYNGDLINTIGWYDPSVQEAKTYLIFPIINVDRRNELLISTQSNTFRIQIYDLNTQNRVAWFGKKTSHFKQNEENISPYLPRNKIEEKSIGLSFPVSVYSTSDYIILYFENATEKFFKTSNFNDKKPYMVVYDKESHDCYGEIALPYILGNVSNDKFYLIKDDNPDNYTIGEYELKESG